VLQTFANTFHRIRQMTDRKHVKKWFTIYIHRESNQIMKLFKSIKAKVTLQKNKLSIS